VPRALGRGPTLARPALNPQKRRLCARGLCPMVLRRNVKPGAPRERGRCAGPWPLSASGGSQATNEGAPFWLSFANNASPAPATVAWLSMQGVEGAAGGPARHYGNLPFWRGSNGQVIWRVLLVLERLPCVVCLVGLLFFSFLAHLAFLSRVPARRTWRPRWHPTLFGRPEWNVCRVQARGLSGAIFARSYAGWKKPHFCGTLPVRARS